MKKSQVPKRKCISCGRWLIPVKDEITNTYTGHVYTCKCLPKNIRIGIG